MTSQLAKTYKILKEKYRSTLILFECNDYIEAINVDAYVVSKILGTTLTKQRDKEQTAITGFKKHSLDTNLLKLKKAGYSVAICSLLIKPPKEDKWTDQNKK